MRPPLSDIETYDRHIEKLREEFTLARMDRQRFQHLFFPDRIAFDGKGFVGTRVTGPEFNYLREIETENERMVDLTGIEPVTS
jgi:hypothetical protein